MSASAVDLSPAARALQAPIAPGRIVVAMSGGVDSSWVAASLAREGRDVVGVSMRLYGTSMAETGGRSCCTPDDLLDAREVASAFGFPFYVANCQDAFRERVIDHFVNEYRRGRTPSPCVMCNDHLKFDLLLERMHALGGDRLATGHYARIEAREGRLALLRGVDPVKDQSYFLFGIRRNLLDKIVFPLGGMTKAEVREQALAMSLPVAAKAESQDICFVGSQDYAQWVEARLKSEELLPGAIRWVGDGRELGRHGGIHRFTVGQRRGIGVAWSEPLYVQRIDPATGDVWVTTVDGISFTRFEVDRCNWLRWETPPTDIACEVQVRYRHRPVAGRVRPSGCGSRAVVELAVPEKAIAPGQAAVFRDGDEVLGGGWIEAVS